MKWFTILFIILVVSTCMSSTISFDGGLIAGWGTNVILGGELNFPMARMLIVNTSIHYAYGGETWRDGYPWVDVSVTHHLIMIGADFSVHPFVGEFESFSPYFDFGGGYTFAHISSEVNGIEDSKNDSGAFFKLLFGTDFLINSTITPYGEMGVWVFTGHDADSDTSFVLMAGLRM